MEELRSTEALDREILEDARKKADRILKTADQTVRTIDQQWKEKTRTALAELEQLYQQRRAKSEQEIMARLPLDKHRLRSEWAEQQLQQAAESFSASLSRDRVLSLMEQDIIKKIDVLSENAETITVSIHGLLKNEAEKLLNRVLKDISWSFGAACSWSDKITYPEIVCEHSNFRLVVSLKTLIDQLLLDKRSELAVALLGKGVVND
ncbi:MAG: hypothetical protein LDL24_03665 [Treponema sp.]|nr:hypothetical protein [Treponema sp.]